MALSPKDLQTSTASKILERSKIIEMDCRSIFMVEGNYDMYIRRRAERIEAIPAPGGACPCSPMPKLHPSMQ